MSIHSYQVILPVIFIRIYTHLFSYTVKKLILDRVFMKKIISSPVFYLLLTGAFIFAVFCLTHGGEDPHFVAVSDAILADNFENDTLSMQFSFQNPEQFGLSEETCALPMYDRENYLSSGSSIAETLNTLKKINPDHLSEETRNTYDVLIPYLEIQEEGTHFLYFEEPLSSTSGIHISLPVLLAEFPIDNEADLNRYLSVLSLIPSYFESLAAFEEDKAKIGMFMASEDADLVISQCDYFASKQGAQFFEQCFSSVLSDLFPDDKVLRKSYAQKHMTIIRNEVLPAYEKLSDNILLLKKSGKERAGLCKYEHGRDYYEYLLQRQIGTNASTKEIAEKLYTRLEDLYLELGALSAETSASNHEYNGETLSAEQCLPALQTEMKELFPSPGGSNPVTIKQIPAALTDFTAPAYYFTPSIAVCRKGDTSSLDNTIYVGSNAQNDNISLFTTLAHEGYPGHMYQNVYFLASQGVNKKNVLRYCMDFPGYSEGWALYTELLSFSYADGNRTYLEMLRISREIQLCLLCILDIRIHDGGADISDISPYLARIGIREPSVVENVYSYLINEPGTYLKYYGGYLELLECKELYRRKCLSGDVTYSDIDFHRFFLEHGPDSYVNIKAAIASKKS